MLYPFMTLSDATEIVHSEDYIENGTEHVRVETEKPIEGEEMDNFFITGIKINKVRHLQNVEIQLSADERKHLILTGKNGSGKTSLLDAMATFLDSITQSTELSDAIRCLPTDRNNLKSGMKRQAPERELVNIRERIVFWENQIKKLSGGVMLELDVSQNDIRSAFENGRFIIAYYKAERIFKAHEPKHVEKVELKNDYTIHETPGMNLIKYLLDLKMTQALAVSNGKPEKAEVIKTWFDRFEGLLRKIFEDDSLNLEFDEDTFAFRIRMDGREPFDFNTLSSGYAAVLDVVVDLILRMEKQTNRKFDFTIPGIVLIDEIETHLHLQMQKKVLDLLTTVFPNIQFIVSTHSPFILNSLKGAVIYDLEKGLRVEDGLTDVPYEGIVERDEQAI